MVIIPRATVYIIGDMCNLGVLSSCLNEVVLFQLYVDGKLPPVMLVIRCMGVIVGISMRSRCTHISIYNACVKQNIKVYAHKIVPITASGL